MSIQYSQFISVFFCRHNISLCLSLYRFFQIWHYSFIMCAHDERNHINNYVCRLFHLSFFALHSALACFFFRLAFVKPLR